MFAELVALGVTLFLIYHFFFEFRGHNLPPGPAPWPFIGNLNYMSAKFHLTLTELGEQYGNVYRLFTGHKLMVVVSGDAIKEALVRQPRDFAGRPENLIDAKGGPGLAMMDYGARWKLYRKLGHSAIKVYGEGRLQEVIGREVSELCKRVEAQNEKPLDISMQFNIAVTNVICTKIFGERFEVDDPDFLKIYYINDQITRTASFSVSIRSAFPFLKKILPQSDNLEKMSSLVKERHEMIQARYEQHVKEFDGETVKDYTDALLYAKQKAEKEDSTTKQHLEDAETIISAGLTSLFTAGSETTSTTLSWAVAYLLHNPDVQDRLHREIDEVIGRDEFPCISSKKSLPVLEAFTAETHRMANLAPIAIPHRTTTDTVLEGYNIPKDTRVMINLWGLHHDPAVWKDPFKFDIDRFLDEEGSFVPPVGGTFLPFGAGPRVCMGEVLARSELFLFLSGLLQKFEFVNPPGCDLPSLEAETGVVLHPEPYLVCVKKLDSQGQ